MGYPLCPKIVELYRGLHHRADSFYLNLGFDIFDGVGGLDFQGDSLASQRFHEDLHLRADSQI